VFGGSPTYTDALGGYEGMLAHHRGLAITPAQRLRFATLLSIAADDASLPDDPEFGLPSWATPNGARASRCTIRNRAAPSPNTHPSHGGAGGWPRRISPTTTVTSHHESRV
jgi:hypothetical protein